MNSSSAAQQGQQYDFTKLGQGVGAQGDALANSDVSDAAMARFVNSSPSVAASDWQTVYDTFGTVSPGSAGAVATSDQNPSDDQMQRLRDLVPVVNGARTDTSIDHAAWQTAYDAVSYATGEVFNGADDAEASVNAAVAAAGALVHPVNTDASTATQATFGNYSLATAGTGVGQVDWQGQPLNGPSNFSLGSAYGNVWNSDESFGGKVVDSFRLLAYTVPDAEQRIAAEQQREAALNAPYATIDALRESPAFAMGFGAGKIAGQSDEDAARWGAGARLGATIFTIGGYARALQVQGGGDTPSREGNGNSAKGWSVGDDIYAPTKAGNDPAWTTVRSRFWKNEAADPQVGTWSTENLDRMSQGLAPQRYNFDKGGLESMELSHEPIPFRDGGKNVVPRWPQDHAAVDPYRRPGY